MFLLFGGLMMFGPALAERYVVVNGQRLSPAQIVEFESAHCGTIPNGRYWLGKRSGIWGYEGNPQPQGHIADNCRRPGRRPSLSERGMLYSVEKMFREGRGAAEAPPVIHREESEIGTTSQPHAPTLQELRP
ncbi:MAG: hypothetical protein IPJ21_06135 [Sterolibacteriaceae bacterium]|nr:hypothetical protein [Sterolibacteriaceae bacterium]MBK9087225.1 hypothetical protein [Sterolibacteriaceae bacterium]